MNNEILNFAPQLLWKHFYNLTQIPRPSKFEEKASEYIINFGKTSGLETLVDEVGNILIRKPATPGYENRKPVILQAHIDMVPQKNSDKIHDFTKDPIEVIVEGEWVKANGTTLGADNGIGVAAALAILEEKNINHGPIECLFTIDEETGMTGAMGIKPGFLKGDILLNLDSEDEGELFIGCAGGIDTIAEFNFSYENIQDNSVIYKIEVKGLKGGHSGMDIVLYRANANKVLNRLVYAALMKHNVQLISINGGSLRNAIPREAFAYIAIPPQEKLNLEKTLKSIATEIINEFKNTDPEITINIIQSDETFSQAIDKETSIKLCQSVYACFDGVYRMNVDMPGVVETSSNLAIIKTEGNRILISSLQRSSIESAKLVVATTIASAFTLAGARVEHSGNYPGWQPNINSEILRIAKETYLSKFGKTPQVKVVHAGLECGIIGANCGKQLDMISFGPTIRYPHSPDEKVNIKSVENFYIFLTEILKNIP